jgi:hypothetical protein
MGAMLKAADARCQFRWQCEERTASVQFSADFGDERQPAKHHWKHREMLALA